MVAEVASPPPIGIPVGDIVLHKSHSGRSLNDALVTVVDTGRGSQAEPEPDSQPAPPGTPRPSQDSSSPNKNCGPSRGSITTSGE